MDDAASAGQRLVYFAAERTVLSWIRTALGLMALGFVLDRFDIFLQRAQEVAGGPGAARTWTGTPLMLTGALMAAVAAGRYLGFAHRYRRQGSTEPGNGVVLASLFAIVVAVLGIVVVTVLLSVGG